MFTFSCSQVVTKDNFRTAVFTAAAQARRKVRILHQLHQPADHPINIYHPEGEYLKGLVLNKERGRQNRILLIKIKVTAETKLTENKE